MKKLLPLCAMFAMLMQTASAQTAQSVVEAVTSGTIASANTPQVALAGGPRLGCQIVNTSTSVEYIDVLPTPVTPIQPGGLYTCNVAPGQVSTQPIYISSATASVTYEVISW